MIPTAVSGYVSATGLAVLYVASLYVWSSNEISSHPDTIRKRFISIFIVLLLCPPYVWFFMHPQLTQNHSLWNLMGFRYEGLVMAAVVPLFLTVLVFLGPVVLKIYRFCNFEHERRSHNEGIWLWLRNYVVAPLSEEFTFRACILLLVLPWTSPNCAILVCPLFFGTAHLHHLYENLRLGVPLRHAVSAAAFQFTYTSIFGVYTAFIFMRTGHLIGPVLVHSFCNFMGFPDFGALKLMPPTPRKWCSAAFVVGLVAWIYLLKPLTDPKLYENDLPWVDLTTG